MTTKESAPQGVLPAIRERGVSAVLKEYLAHSALNAGQAARDVRYLFNHPAADMAAPEGSLQHALASLKPRVKSLATNTYYAAIPPHMHHEAEDLIRTGPVSAKSMFLHGYKPWDYPDPLSMKKACDRGSLAALRRFKLAGPMGADPGVMPTGDEQSHGTERIQYAPRGAAPNAPAPSAAQANMPGWLLDNFTTYDHIAPGRADGTFGQEVIG